MKEIIIIIDVLAAVGIVALVLLQQGKGADMGAAFGSGASATLFGARGSANFLTRATAILATIFFLANMTLAYMATRESGPQSVIQSAPTAPAGAVEQPKTPEPPAEKPPSAPSLPEVPK